MIYTILEYIAKLGVGLTLIIGFGALLSLALFRGEDPIEDYEDPYIKKHCPFNTFYINAFLNSKAKSKTHTT